jgi:L-ascorbate metabolism protein UlaG (beta-lactamase superfamily)
MKIHFLRHATSIIDINGFQILVDPMLSPSGAMDAISHTPNPRRNPLIDLPLKNEKLFDLIYSVDAILITHTHSDHWDKAAQSLLPKGTELFCQPEDEDLINVAGFSAVQPIISTFNRGDIEFIRTGGQHGTGDIGQRLGPVSGFILRSKDAACLYIAGDTIWCQEVEQALADHQPDIVMVNAGGARFLEGDAITMTASDVAQVCQTAPNARVIAVHMEAINHCELTRKELRDYLENKDIRAVIPEDGERLYF